MRFTRFRAAQYLKKERNGSRPFRIQDMKKDVIIVGAGPAGIFTALELLRQGSKKSVMIVEKGRSVEQRVCPKQKTGRCMNCKPYCHITTGFSGSGAPPDTDAITSVMVTEV